MSCKIICKKSENFCAATPVFGTNYRSVCKKLRAITRDGLEVKAVVFG